MLIYKISAVVFIYSNVAKFEAIQEVKEFFEKDVMFETFNNIAIYSGVVFSRELSFINIILTVIPEVLIGLAIIALNYVSSEKIGEEYMNKQDVLQEKSLIFGSTSLSLFLVLSLEYLAVVNISWIGLIFQLFVIFVMFSFVFKKGNRLFIVDLICLLAMFLAPCQLILLFFHEISLVPMGQLEPVFDFIGADQDRSTTDTAIHATGAISVFILGIVYLRSRRLDIMLAMYEHEYGDLEDSDVGPSPYLINVSKPEKVRKSMPVINERLEDENSDFDQDQDDLDDGDDDEKHLVWKVYDSVIEAFTSEFVVLNICRLGLCFWILRYNCIQSIPIIIFLFHSTLVKSMVKFLPFIKFLYLPYM